MPPLTWLTRGSYDRAALRDIAKRRPTRQTRRSAIPLQVNRGRAEDLAELYEWMERGLTIY